MKITLFFPLLCMMNYVRGHGSMWLPPPRSEGADAPPSNVGGCYNGACMWFNQGCTIGCDCNERNDEFFGPLCNTSIKPTLPRKYQTFNLNNNDTVPPFVPQDWSQWHPWRAPGTANPMNPCGLAGGSTKNNDIAGGFGNDTIAGVQGFAGSKLSPVTYQTVWKAGSIAEVAWSTVANHGGGYIYRVCPAEAELTEECFMNNILDFAGPKQSLVWMNGDRVEIDATRVTEGVFPKGSTWTKNPIPPCNGIGAGYKGVCPGPAFPPPEGCNKTCWGYQPCDICDTLEIPGVVDQLQIPKDLKPGNYVLSFRWDCEQTPQIWSSCGDVTITA